MLTFWEPSDITKKSSTSAPAYWLIFIHRYSIFPVRIFLDHPPGGPGRRSWLSFLWLQQKRRRFITFSSFLLPSSLHRLLCLVIADVFTNLSLLCFSPSACFFPSPLRFVSSHDKVLRVQLAEAPAWVHAGRRLLRQIWWGKTFSHALKSLKFVQFYNIILLKSTKQA